MLFPVVLFFMAFGCKNEKLAPIELGHAYFPLRIGATLIYDVDSVNYNDFTKPVITVTQYNFQLKDSITGTFTDLENMINYRIERYKKTESQPWVFQRIITKRLVNGRAEEFVDNKRYVRFAFPPLLGKTWNGNAYNIDEPWTYEITSVSQPLTIGQTQLDATVTVTQYNEINLIQEKVYKETYAQHIGLAFKEVRDIEKDITSGQIMRGNIYSYTFNKIN